MRFVWTVNIWLNLSILFIVNGIGQAVARGETAPTGGEIIQKAVRRAQGAEIRSGKEIYTYKKVSLTEELDASGKVKEHKEKIYQVSFQGGLTHVKLLAVNGRPPAGGDVKKQAENEMSAKQLLGESKSGPAASRDNFLTPELAARFDFKLIDQTVINGRAAYQITFEPKNPEPPVHRIADRLLNRISGTVWIDAEEFEVARADIQLRSEVNLLGGVIGSLKKLAYTVTRTRVGDGVWFNSFSSGDFEGRKLLDSMRIKTKSETSNFRILGLAS
jgi:hypothetical protein